METEKEKEKAVSCISLLIAIALVIILGVSWMNTKKQEYNETIARLQKAANVIIHEKMLEIIPGNKSNMSYNEDGCYIICYYDGKENIELTSSINEPTMELRIILDKQWNQLSSETTPKIFIKPIHPFLWVEIIFGFILLHCIIYAVLMRVVDFMIKLNN